MWPEQDVGLNRAKLFSGIRVRDGEIVAVKLAPEEYLPLIASAEARVWMARPEGFEPPTY